MNSIVLIAAICSALALIALAKSNWGQEERDYILEIHNEKRRKEGGCMMNKLVYDMELERQAEQWAKGCVFKHEMKEGRGENLAWDSNKKPEKELILGSSGRWFDEKKMYSYGQYSCGSSCHYTQMVWGSTSKVGCYSYRCPKLVGAYKNAWYLVCFYTPKGNWNGEKPYDKTCKSKCADGQTEEKGLCVGGSDNSEGEDMGGSDNPEGEDNGGSDNAEGEDKGGSENSEGKDNGGSDNAEGEDKGGSENSEGEDNGGSNNAEGEDKGGSENSEGEVKGGKENPGGEDGGCKDDDKRCAGWAKHGECNLNPRYMNKNCKMSCKICISKTSCEDSNTESAKGGSENSGGMDEGGSINAGGKNKGGSDNAKGEDKGGSDKTNKDGDCIDKDKRCAYWGKRNECNNTRSYLFKYCRLTCGFCKS